MDETGSEDVRPEALRWLVGLRRGWVSSRALARWARDRGVTGAVWTPASYDVDDVATALHRLVSSGARSDASLLWDMAVQDVRGAADALAGVCRASDRRDGYVAAWIDEERMEDAGRARAAARELFVEVRRANLAVAVAWTPERAAAIEAIVADGIPVAVSGARDEAACSAVAAARERGMEHRRAEADEEEDVLEVPVFCLGGAGAGDWVTGVRLLTELDLYSESAPAAGVPLSPGAERAGWRSAVEALERRAKEPATDEDFAPGSFAVAVTKETDELAADDVLSDIWSRDHTLWKDDPTEISDRLGWLDVTERMAAEVDDMTGFAREVRAGGEVDRIVLCGMGGASLAAETLVAVVGGGLPLTVVDTTDPDHVAAVTSSVDPDKSVFVIASKSGTTIETRTLADHFWRGDGSRYVAITDEGTPLADLARQRGFRRVFTNPADIGGRYSGLSYFGLVPAALAGVDIGAVIEQARRAVSRNGPSAPPRTAPAVRLAAAIAHAALKEDRDKLTLVLPPKLAPFGAWVEQLVAESTGKESSGVVPVVDEPLAPADAYGLDRIFCAYTIASEPAPPEMESLEAEHPVIRIRIPEPGAIGAEMYRWEMATAIVGYLLDVNPFDQPDVEAAKARTREILSAPPEGRPDPGSLDDLLMDLAPPRYVGIQAFVTPSQENIERVRRARTRIRDRYKVAVTAGFGPRFLHSTGQLHKGGPGTGVFVQVVQDHALDVAVAGHSLGRLIDAQADGDLQALREAGRRVARIGVADLDRLGVA